MPPAAAYGETLAGTFRAENEATLVSSFRREAFAVTRLRRSEPMADRTAPLRPEAAFHFGYELVARGEVELWTGPRLARRTHLAANTFSMVDIALEPSARAEGKQDSLLYYVTRRALDDLSAERGGGSVVALGLGPGVSVVDRAVHHLGLALLPALEAPTRTSQLFFDHVALAFQEHVLAAYCRLTKPMRAVVARLAPWQERRAKEIVAASLHGAVSIATLAAECRLSRPHFVRAFKATVGRAPHRWLTEQRVEAAKALLRDGTVPLHHVATRCGFAHKAHFAKVFRQLVGESPRAWQRRNGRLRTSAP